jgi:hypothetical protein
MMNLKPVLDGDGAFRGVDLRNDPEELPPGVVQVSENLRLGDQRPRPRNGISFQTPAGLELNLDGSGIRHAAVYRPEGAADALALVLGDRLVLWDTTTGLFDEARYADGVTVPAGEAVDFVQAGIASGTTRYGYILRGFEEQPLEYDGTAVAVTTTWNDSGSPATGFPPGEFGLFYQDRLAVNVDEQTLAVSGFLDFANWSLLSQFTILKGGDDRLMGMVPFQSDKVLILGRKSVHVAFFDPTTDTTGYTGTITADASWLRQITRAFGCVARRTLIEDGGNVYFLSDHGFVNLSPTLDLNLVGSLVPLTARLEPVMSRLSSNFAGGACAVAHRDRIYLALPINPEAVEVESAISHPTNPTTLTTTDEHGLATGDTVEVSGFPQAFRVLNGLLTVTGTPTATTFTVAEHPGGATAQTVYGTGRCWAQKVVSRNNTVLVLNKLNAAPVEGEGPEPYWESVDTLPDGIYADWLLVADAGSQRRVWMVDRFKGPALYDEGNGDDTGTASGGFILPEVLPFTLAAANWDRSPVAARLVTRRYTHGSAQVVKPQREARVRFKMNSGARADVTFRSFAPDGSEQAKTETFTSDSETEVRRVGLGTRGVASEIEVSFRDGIAVVESVAAHTLAETETLSR